MSKERVGIACLVALAAGLLTVVWRMADPEEPTPALELGVDDSRVPVGDLRAAELGRPGAARSIDDGQRVSVGTGLGGDATEAESGPLEWTLQFSLDRSGLRSPRSHLQVRNDASGAYHAAVFLGTGGTVEFGRTDLPSATEVSMSFRQPDHASALEGASFLIATCPQGVGSSSQVFFGGAHGRVGMALSDAVSFDREQRVIDLGKLVLEPVPQLGTLRVHSRDDADSFSAFVSSAGLERKLLGQFGRPIPGQLKAFSSAGGEVPVYSFGPGTRWSVLFKTRLGDLITSVEEERGQDITIEYDRPQGVSVSVDLKRYSEASRVVLVSSDLPLFYALDPAGYDARVKGALATQAIPLPRFRSSGVPFTTVVTGLDDGPLRVELWARIAVVDGSATEPGALEWTLLDSQPTSVAGDVVEVNF